MLHLFQPVDGPTPLHLPPHVLVIPSHAHSYQSHTHRSTFLESMSPRISRSPSLTSTGPNHSNSFICRYLCLLAQLPHQACLMSTRPRHPSTFHYNCCLSTPIISNSIVHWFSIYIFSCSSFHYCHIKIISSNLIQSSLLLSPNISLQSFILLNI